MTRSLLLTFCLGLFAITSSPAQDSGVQIGLQTWTLRNMKFEQVVDFAVRHKIKFLQLIPGTHIDLAAPKDQLLQKKAVLDKNGLVCYTVGVVGTSLKEEENRKLFEGAKTLGLKLLIVEPSDFKILDNLEVLAKEFDIKVAIHNHGIKSLYGNPEVVKNLIKHRDRRIGVCLDAGHVTGAGFDAAKVYRDYDGRVYDIHMKDKAIKEVTGADDVILDVKIGTGKTNFKGLFAELKKSNWNGVLAIETDNGQFAANPEEYVSEAITFAQALK